MVMGGLYRRDPFDSTWIRYVVMLMAGAVGQLRYRVMEAPKPFGTQYCREVSGHFLKVYGMYVIVLVHLMEVRGWKVRVDICLSRA